MRKPLMLMILDGFGESDERGGNAIYTAKTPNIDALRRRWGYTLIEASGEAVGLPERQMGNSEVGHTNIGAGRVVWQELSRISRDIRDGSFFENEELLAAMQNARNGALHLMGLLSDGGVHSHNTHLYALLDMAKRNGVERVYIHAFLDGRDVPPMSGAEFMRELTTKCAETGASVATVSGRYYGMDRDNRYERLIKAYRAIVHGEGVQNPDPVDAIENSYADGVTDEFVLPVVCDDRGMINGGDSVIFFNFRPDRAREITRALVDENFAHFEREKGALPLCYVCFTEYDATIPHVSVAFKAHSLDNTFGEYISERGLTQLRIAETEKYAHVTFFFNGGRELQYENEDRVLIKSPSVATYDMQPEMSAREVAESVIERIAEDRYDVIILNFANCDMVGHTGVFDAAVKAVETVDECVGRVWEALKKKDGILLLTADHGNAERMREQDGSPFTAHTTNPVMFLIAGRRCHLRDGGALADIAPTMLSLLGLEKPFEMSGESLIK